MPGSRVARVIMALIAVVVVLGLVLSSFQSGL
jgi:hypothetical protein